MSRFDECLSFVLKWEGGYSDHPSDRGGPTNQGITQRVYDDWRLKQKLPMQPVRFLASNERDDIYRRRYWDVVHCGDMPEPVDLALFDACVNSGPKQAAKWLQRALGVKDDGIIGPVTISAAANSSPVFVFNDILYQRSDFYDGLVERDPTQAVFLSGWKNRINSLMSEVA